MTHETAVRFATARRPLSRMGGVYSPLADLVSEPAPRTNPRGDLDGAWRIRDLRDGAIVARFDRDGRDRAEIWARRKWVALYREKRCELCARHYGDDGVCDEGKPVASPHREHDRRMQGATFNTLIARATAARDAARS